MKKYKIFLVVDGRATPKDDNRMWLKNLYEPLVALGHKVVLFDIADFENKHEVSCMSPEAKELLSNELPIYFDQANQEYEFDIFLSYLHTKQIHPDAYGQIAKQLYTINYSTNFHQFDIYKDISKHANLNLFATKIAKDGYDKLGVKSYWMPFAANEEFCASSEVKNDKVVFIGSAYGYRPYLFWRALQLGVDLNIYGVGWLKDFKSIKEKLVNKKGLLRLIVDLPSITSINRRLIKFDQYNREAIIRKINLDFPEAINNAVSDVDYFKIISEAAIVLNIQSARYNFDVLNPHVLFGTNLRDFEITARGSFLLSQHSEEMGELFNVGSEVVTYHDEFDLAEKAKYYLKHGSEREEIAKRGHERCLRDHTWKKRFDDLFFYIDKLV
ncbi:hypothetical protein COT94_01830 [Candidatus Falkowbacteria bacterium CG10_big_fil_rev_8_21_14_0_10_37_14]|uniref:Spore protein YkvP/CgeB glycosyl transferase-like domain-containing protein n=1 Tax=Candidatus Falkowbacteria bacterium CG10_big_fil_rev_8_21_14_0_10_37_14 TaxID=1974561 RepID=A0A2M6WTY7_9BACT|nr:glycosyltransferase [Candidatus Falkowbacteria bacterium]PIT96186.1 MAG: hypothetical protein COT94_01830 [Candidatus Falkowbacteria bacterium CG10_big_fil_rev_8_21_14_0_10_37_14]